MKKDNKSSSAGTKVESSTKAEVEQVSQPIAKPSVSRCAFMVLRGKDYGNVFWTRGGEYRTDWYELLFESNDEEAVKNHWHLRYFGSPA